MKPSERLSRLPPYLFAELERKIAERKAAGVDVISLGIGDPDTPTPELVVAALTEAAADPGTHQYPSNRGRAEFRAAVAGFYSRRFGVELDPETEIIPAIGAKECIFNLNLAFLDPGDAAAAGAGLRPRPGRDRLARARPGPADVSQLPEQPNGRDRPGWAVRGGRGLRPRARRARG